ncbi:MAG: LLM class flavin-dependent oxidoreductase [Candidatus Kariarchaeaceae archaeon]|jgi:alkanesulfonate monooxygenase SsuD/methylene tetrahydromethanopterin reductase-like flavin-dependent oxidoreductase (luciferase family)
MDFGIYLRKAVTYPQMLKLALHAEKLGFKGSFLNDHIIGFENEGKEDYLEAWTAMTGIGMQTTKLRVGQIVLFNSIRNPAFLAKSIASLDQMTNGRYELLIGAGWNEQEYLGYDLMEGGRGMPSAKERVDRFEETLQILKLMLNQEETNYDGKFWKLKGAINMPLPIQRPMRISVGCSKPRMMNITAKYADGINIAARSIPDIEARIKKFGSIAASYDKTLKDYYLSGFLGFQIGRNEKEVEELAKPVAKRLDIPIDQVLSDYFIGTSDNIIEKLQHIKNLGLEMVVSQIDVHKSILTDPLDFFHENVMRQL